MALRARPTIKMSDPSSLRINNLRTLFETKSVSEEPPSSAGNGALECCSKLSNDQIHCCARLGDKLHASRRRLSRLPAEENELRAEAGKLFPFEWSPF